MKDQTHMALLVVANLLLLGILVTLNMRKTCEPLLIPRTFVRRYTSAPKSAWRNIPKNLPRVIPSPDERGL